MKNMKLLVWILATILVVLCVAAVLLEVNLARQKALQDDNAAPGEYSDMYTWEEFQALSTEEKEAFFQSFESAEAFEAWKNAAMAAENTEPSFVWDKPGKKPDAYTWEEYQALTAEEQEAFFRWFDSVEDFEAWMGKVKPAEGTTPVLKWDKPGKTPDAYTWEEYQALTPEEQEAFYQWFDTAEAFETWMEKVKSAEGTTPTTEWDKPGKTPDAYTWEEYQALTPEEQEAFYQWFGSVEDFEAWMEKANPEGTEPSFVWDKPGKTPDAYTWEEYQALTPEEQEAFYRWFDSLEDFETWMKKVKPAEDTGPSFVWDKPGKTPDAYTWEEYQALTPEEKEAFYQWFDSVEAFEAWMAAATNAT